jgi:hypothetical protein
MVDVGDYGCEERERMVELAIENGWIQKVAGWAAKRHNTPTVVVLATTDCPTDIGPLGAIVAKAVGQIDRMPKQMRRIQEADGCTPFVVFSLPLQSLCQLVDPGTGDDLREAARSEFAVFCMNADSVVLISGVSKMEGAA